LATSTHATVYDVTKCQSSKISNM